MRGMSFHLATPQMLARTKTVTRRIGWGRLKPGDMLLAFDRCQGIKMEDRIRLGVIRVVSAVRQRLDAITPEDVEREGFPGKTPGEFVEMFTANMKCAPDRYVTRIEFEFAEEPCQPSKSTKSRAIPKRSRRPGSARSSSSSG